MPKFRTISGQFVGYVPDGTDPDINPDREPMNGRVTFTPVFTGGVIAFPELSPPEFAHPEPISARIIDGFVQVQVGTDDDVSMQPLSLMVTVDDEASQVWSWRAEFTNMRIGTGEVEVTIPSWSFRVPDGTGPVDLTELVPLKSGGSVDVTKGPRGAGLENITAVDGQLVFEYTDGQESTVPIPEAVQGPQGEPGPAGADGEQGPEGPQGPAGEIPDLLVGNITDATPTGKNLMLAATEGAARNALGLAAGATSIAGSLEELNNGTQTNSRVWSPRNLAEYTAGRIEAMRTEVNVKDYGAKGDGVADDHTAIMNAIGSGGRKVVFPAGTYMISDSITVPSNTEISGSGIDVTVIKFLDTAPVAVWGITNRDREAGNTNIYIHGLTVDWNVQRTGSTAVPPAGGGSNASCVTFGHVTHSRISHVKAINAGLHGFDVTCASVTYPYEGDGAPDAAGPSQYIYIDNCEAEAWGDDGFTTHHSEFIFITNCYAHDARQRGNNNAFEIDDGSRHIYLSGNTSRNCYAGIEIKAHGNASAGRQVQIAGHLSVNDVRSYNWRHIGHHSGSDPVSVSAFDIIASDLVSLWPNNNLGYYEDAQPRSIVISAFGRVSVTNFTAIGDPGYDYASQPAAAIQYRAHDVTLTNFNSSGFTTASADMLISGTTNNIAINGFVANKSALRGLQIGTGVGTISLSGLRLTGTGTGLHGVDAGNVQSTAALNLADDFFITGYTNVVRMFSTNYTSKSHFLMGSPAVPSGTTSMKALSSERSYYISSANFANMGSDRPAGEEGSWMLYNESASVAGSVVMQRLVKSVITGEPVQYFRILNRADGGVTNWYQVPTTAVDYES